MKLKTICIAVSTALCMSAAGCVTAGETEVQREIFSMDTIMTVRASGKNAQAAVDEAVAEIERLNALFSVGIPDSEIARLNESGSGSLSEDSLYLVKRSLEIYAGTDGAYDMTVYPLMKLWGFTGDEPALPDDKKIRETLALCGSEKVTLEGSRIVLGEAQGIDLGGIAKGYTSSRIMGIFAKHGVASGMVSLGGNVQCLGTKPDGSLWRCGITDPEDPDDSGRLLGVLSVRDKAVITSGGYERFFTENGKTYHHIMDMKTGYPAESGLLSVTIISEDGTLADALSTALYVMGPERAVSYWQENSSSFDMILLTSDGRLLVTQNIMGSFETDRTDVEELKVK